MKNILNLFIILNLILINSNAICQQVKDFHYVEPETKNLPVFVRGNLNSKRILLYVQGGDAENGIDFGRSDYPKWKNTLEKEVAIAYFDQRGLNRKVKQIDTTQINAAQVLKDIIAIAKFLQKRYQSEIYLIGHSMGGVSVLKCLATFPRETSFIKSGIVFNTPITTDFSPQRYSYYRPLYLKNVAKEFIDQGKDVDYWQKAYDWMVQTGSISTIEASKQWNTYVDSAYPSSKRKIGLSMVYKTIFAKPYNPIKYLNNKDNQFIGDRLWREQAALWEANQQTTLLELLPKIQQPILLITGRYDAIATPEEQESAFELITNSELVIIPDCTHESFLDQPYLFNEALLNYLK